MMLKINIWSCYEFILFFTRYISIERREKDHTYSLSSMHWSCPIAITVTQLKVSYYCNRKTSKNTSACAVAFKKPSILIFQSLNGYCQRLQFHRSHRRNPLKCMQPKTKGKSKELWRYGIKQYWWPHILLDSNCISRIHIKRRLSVYKGVSTSKQ